jgi:hypothetical protein
MTRAHLFIATLAAFAWLLRVPLTGRRASAARPTRLARPVALPVVRPVARRRASSPRCLLHTPDLVIGRWRIGAAARAP